MKKPETFFIFSHTYDVKRSKKLLHHINHLKVYHFLNEWGLEVKEKQLYYQHDKKEGLQYISCFNVFEGSLISLASGDLRASQQRFYKQNMLKQKRVKYTCWWKVPIYPGWWMAPTPLNDPDYNKALMV